MTWILKILNGRDGFRDSSTQRVWCKAFSCLFFFFGGADFEVWSWKAFFFWKLSDKKFSSLNHLAFCLEDVSIEEDHEDTEYNFMAEANQKEEKEEYRNDRAVRITRKLHKSSKTTLKISLTWCNGTSLVQGYTLVFVILCCGIITVYCPIRMLEAIVKWKLDYSILNNAQCFKRTTRKCCFCNK